MEWKFVKFWIFLFEKSLLCSVDNPPGGLLAAEIGTGGRPRFYFHFYFLPPGKFSSKSITLPDQDHHRENI